MTSSIYRIRPRGQMVNEACQWIVEHHRLVVSIVVKPVLLLAAIAMADQLFINSTVLTIVPVIAAILLVPALPAMVMEVAENPDDYDYPNHIPQLMELRGRWWFYFRKALVVYLLCLIASTMLSVTIVVPLVLAFAMPFATVICQRDEDMGYISAFGKCLNYMFTNFANTLLVALGICIIGVSMCFGPFAVLYLMAFFVRSVLSPEVMNTIRSIARYGNVDSIIYVIPCLGYVFAYLTSVVILNFFYGHCVTKEEEYG